MQGIMEKLLSTANENGVDSLTALADWLPSLFKENTELKKKINDAKNCLVCAGIADPFEVCENTLSILDGGDVATIDRSDLVHLEKMRDRLIEHGEARYGSDMWKLRNFIDNLKNNLP